MVSSERVGEPITTIADLVASLPGIVWEADGTDFRQTYVSVRARDLLGYDPFEWLATPRFWEDHLHPDDRDRAIGSAQEATASMSGAVLDYRFLDGWGGYRWFRDYLRVVQQADGHRHLVGFMVDVDAEASADEARRLLATAVDGAAESVVVTEADGTIVYVNPAFERVTGYGRDEAIGQNPRILKSGAHPRTFYAAMWRRLTAGERWAGELVNRRRDGTLMIEEASITPVEDPRSGRRRYLAVKRDVTSEREDRAARDWLTAAVESAIDAVYAVSLDGVFMAWNDAAARIYGWDADEILGRSVFEVAPGLEHDSIRDWMARASQGESIGPVDAIHHGEGGRELTLSVIATPVRDRAGRVTGVATIARDTSTERRAAAEREALELELRQAQRMDAIGRLAGAVAHDFNNLLTAIRGYADLAAADLSGPAREDIAEIMRATDRASDLTRRLLAFARSGAIVQRRVRLDDALQESARLVRRLVPERISFTLDTASAATVLADPGEIDQILVNLVVNAVDAIEGTGSIHVRCEQAPQSGSVMVTVRDTGAGIPPAVLERIFQPFFTTKSEGRGTGLGLATVSAIVTRMGGSISASSTHGLGTTFTITIPLTDEAAPIKSAVSELPISVQSGLHVLLVEDDPVLRALAARMLADAGLHVTSAASGRDVLEIPLRHVDVMVCDVVMPGMSGPDLRLRMRHAPPTVFVSGYTNDEPLGATPGRWVFLPKPYTSDGLLGAIALVLAKHGRGLGPGDRTHRRSHPSLRRGFSGATHTRHSPSREPS